jgi:hypothetical protein
VVPYWAAVAAYCQCHLALPPDRAQNHSKPVNKDKSSLGSLVWINPANEEDQLDFSKIA